MSYERSISGPLGPRTPSAHSFEQLSPTERAFSCHAAAAKCDDVSAQLVLLAELLRCARSNASGSDLQVSERAIVDCLIRSRRLREKFFQASLFADPVWDIFLDLYLARLDQRRTTVSSLCIAAAVPSTTALRHIGSLVRAGFLIREPSNLDHRVAYIELSDAAAEQMSAYVARLSELFWAALGA